MIRRLEGTLLNHMNHSVLLDVHGVGYLISVPYALSEPVGSTIALYTHLAVRENALDLFGFLLLDELELFEQLLTLQKIGPKSALQILTQADLTLIKTAVANNDPGHLSKLSGLGKKTAEKVVTGLAALYERQGLVLTPGVHRSGTGGPMVNDTIDALIALGYTEGDARKAVKEVTERTPELTETNAILKAALRFLS